MHLISHKSHFLPLQLLMFKSSLLSVFTSFSPSKSAADLWSCIKNLHGISWKYNAILLYFVNWITLLDKNWDAAWNMASTVVFLPGPHTARISPWEIICSSNNIIHIWKINPVPFNELFIPSQSRNSIVYLLKMEAFFLFLLASNPSGRLCCFTISRFTKEKKKSSFPKFRSACQCKWSSVTQICLEFYYLSTFDRSANV